MPRAFDSDGEGALALRGEAGLAARFDLAALGKEPAQAGDILVVNLINTIGGEDVHTTATATTAAKAATATTKAATATTATEPATATTVTAEAATAATIATTIIGAGRAILTRRAIVRCPLLRALLISHGLFLLKHAYYCA
jgi:hypothetical protein